MNSSPTRSRHYTLSHVYVYFVYSVYFGSCPPIDSISSTQNRYPFQIIIIFCPKFHKNALFLHFLAKKFAKPQMFIVPLQSRSGFRKTPNHPSRRNFYQTPTSIYIAPKASVLWNIDFYCTFFAFPLHMSKKSINFAPAKLWAWASEWGWRGVKGVIQRAIPRAIPRVVPRAIPRAIQACVWCTVETNN